MRRKQLGEQSPVVSRAGPGGAGAGDVEVNGTGAIIPTTVTEWSPLPLRRNSGPSAKPSGASSCGSGSNPAAARSCLRGWMRLGSPHPGPTSRRMRVKW